VPEETNFIDAPVLFVVTRVDDDLPGVRDVYGCVLVPDASEPGVLARFGVRVEGSISTIQP
jgi:hypothetical protein